MEKLDARSILAFVRISPETGSTRQIISPAQTIRTPSTSSGQPVEPLSMPLPIAFDQ